ncbi:MAG: hypothetical protein KDA59_20280 [Planctomycetales bacterium]|nr:hypothetical protein [Planctomycetales bacterium]
MSRNLFLRASSSGALFVAVVLMIGCGGDSGPTRYEVSGTVTYQGQPVPKGFVTFSPDTSQGNSGPGGGAEIVDGHYETAAGKGVIGGPHQVRIVGYDGIPISMEGEELTDGQPLFTPYITTIDFPAEDSTQDFTIPSGDGGG